MKRASVLLVSLWTLSLITALVISVGSTQRAHIKRVRINYEKTSATELARSALTTALLRLEEYINEDPDREINYKDEIFLPIEITLATGTAHYQIFDESSLIDLNKNALVKKNILLNLPSSSPAIAGAITDWYDQDDIGTDGDGAETAYYEGLDVPYKCKNGDFNRIEELLLLRDVDREFYDNAKELLTLYGSDKVNLNTVSAKTLAVLLISADSAANPNVALADNVAQKLIEYRDQAEGSEDNKVFRELESLLIDVGLTMDDERNIFNALFLNAQMLKFNSSNFRIVVSAQSNNYKVKTNINAIYDFTDPAAIEMIYYYQE